MTFFKLVHIRHALALVVLAIGTIATARAAPGDVDPTFDPGPILWQGFAFPAFKYATVIQPDGKIVVGGQFDTVAGAPRVFIARLNTNGSLDTTFVPPLQTINSGGSVTGEVYDILLQPDGKMVVSGFFLVGGVYKTVVRLNSDGSLDSSFNVTTNNGSTKFNHIYRMLLQPDGKIIIGSNALNSVNGVTTNRLARLTTTGSLDAPLGVTGNVLYSVFALALQPDGKIVIGGGGGGGGVVGRLNPNGTEDPGWTQPDIGLVSVDSLAIEADGQILVGARGRLMVNGQLRDGLIRLNPNGTFDLTFDPPDIRVAWSLYIQNDGKILVGGSFTVNFGLFLAAFGRINPDGSLDFIPSGGGPDNDIFDIARQQDGKYILGGAYENVYHGKSFTPRTGVGRFFDTGGVPPRLKINSGNILVGSPGEGLILRSPNGSTCIKLGIDNAGAMTTAGIPCP